jgi:glutamate dehydrogenase/leucine dehydrogenase
MPMNDDVWRFADDLGPEKIVYLHDPATGLRAIVVVDNVACGPSIGGARMEPDVSVDECARLARAMTLKNAAAGIPHGGGKSVIFADPKMDLGEKERLVRSFARAIGDIRDYIVGPDMGTDETCMAWCRDEIGRAVGLPPELGGIPLDEIGATGFGLSVCAEAAQGFCDVDLNGARFVVQGFGSVGRHVARFLSEKGARLVAAADSRGGVATKDGLDVDALLAHKAEAASVSEFAGGEAISGDALLDIACDIFVPAARPDVIRMDNVQRVTAKLILPGANIAVTHDAERALHDRGVLVIPDFIANAGGVICASVEYHGGSEHQAFAAIEEKIRANTNAVLADAAERGQPPRVAAQSMAERRVRRAMALRR